MNYCEKMWSMTFYYYAGSNFQSSGLWTYTELVRFGEFSAC